jgi:Tol biopolymer transport system component
MTNTGMLLFVVQAVALPADTGEVRLKNIRQLTFGGQNAEGYFSESGKEIIFQRHVADSSCDQIYLIGVDGTNMRRVSPGARQTCGYFYQGDQRIFFSSTHHLGPACPPPPDYSRGYVWKIYNYDIYSSRTDGTDLRTLASTPDYEAEATLSPDGKKIVFTSLREGDIDIYSMDVDGSNVRRLTTRVGYEGGPFFSPDGKLIVYRARHPETAADTAGYLGLLRDHLVRPLRMEIWVMNADGTEQRQVTQLGGDNFAPYFHPDGRRIIFASNHLKPGTREFDLYLVGMDGTGLERVTTNSEFDAFPMFSRDGSKIVWASNRNGKVRGETNIFVADWVERP